MTPKRKSNPTDPLHLDLPWSEVRQWHEEVCEECDDAVELCTGPLVPLVKPDESMAGLTPETVLTLLLGDTRACRLFGTPDGEPVVFSDETDILSQPEAHQWGLRVHRHAAALKDGFCLREKIDPDENVAKNRLILELMSKRYVRTFPAIPTTIDSAEQQLWESKGNTGFPNFALTRSDPTLYAASYYLSHHQDELPRVSPPVKFLLAKVRDALTRFVRSERDFAVSDDANLWWAHCELLRYEGKHYTVNGRSGCEVAAEVCRRLIEKGADLQTLNEAQALHETPPEVFGMDRTRFYVLKNCFDIASEMPSGTSPVLPTGIKREIPTKAESERETGPERPREVEPEESPRVDTELFSRLSDFAGKQFQAVRNKDRGSLYFLGLSLQVSSTAMGYYNRFVAPNKDQSLGAEDAAQLPKSQAWLEDDGFIVIEYENGLPDQFHRITRDFRELIEHLVDSRGFAACSDLRVKKVVNNPSEVFGRIFRKDHQHNILRPYCWRKRGVYYTSIKRRKKPKKEEREE